MRLPLVRCVVMLALPLLVAPLAAEAQPAGVHRVGYLLALPSSATAHLREAFRHGLRELGYVEGHNIVIEFRNAGGIERLPELAAELVRLNVDVIVAAPDVSIRPPREQRGPCRLSWPSVLTIPWNAGSWPASRAQAATSRD